MRHSDAEWRETIAARRREIYDQARCSGCGATRAECDRLRAQHPDEPIGCCSGSGDEAGCRHVPDRSALRRLLDEIEAGDVAPVEAEIGPLHDRPRPATFSWLLHQGEWWHPNGRPMLRITEMDPAWRYNTAAFLLRHARSIADAESWREITVASTPLGPSGDFACEAFGQEMHQMAEDPEGWLRRTPLYRALTRDLPPEGGKRRAWLAELARHYSTCPRRQGHGDCTCSTPETVARSRHM